MATGVPGSDLKSYFENARSWDADRARKAEAEKRTAWRVAVVAGVIALGAIIFHVIAPLRSVEPYVIRVDQKTGAADVVSVLRDPTVLTSNEAVRKYFLADYVRSRESWVWSAREELFQRAASLSSSTALKKFRAERNPQTNPKAPVLTFTNGETIGVSVRNITFISDRVAQIRFAKIMERGGVEIERTDWVAIIDFEFSETPATEESRLLNPLGFVVISYRADPEIEQ